MILITGGTGYIGSHTILELIRAGYKDLLVIDNLINSSEESLKAIKEITNVQVTFKRCDLRNELELEEIFDYYNINEVIHFAGLKAVGESVENPLMYYDNNLIGTITLLKVMHRHDCLNIIFSSSATVYGTQEMLPIKENANLSATNPYGRTKLFIEEMLKDLFVSDNKWNIIILRYFNPVGADESGLLGEKPAGTPNNLMPIISEVATGKRKKLYIFGDDYDTPDGTCIRDYIHVSDLAKGHVKALEKLNYLDEIKIINLGTGNGYSVKEMIDTFSSINKIELGTEITERRPGDIAKCFADVSLAKNFLCWSTTKSLEDICASEWKWQQNKINGE